MNTKKNYEVKSIMYNYESYYEKSVHGRYVNHDQVKKFLKKFENNSLFNIRKAGTSFEGRQIDLIKIGHGKTKVFFWSQMHGDESTSTRAILDLLNFLAANDENQNKRDKIFENITLYVIPMLNPDGAERFARRNVQQMDINRDAVAQQTPEGKLLYDLKNEIKPDWGFNLHDQSSGYSAGLNYKSSTISLLAPPFNNSAEINEVRKKAMKLIVSLYEELSDEIPGHIARYDDEFEPRAFGDNFTKDGVSTILIEAGGWGLDSDREYVRKLFFSALVKSLLLILDNSFTEQNENEYFNIPENKERLYDLVLRNISFSMNDQNYKMDIAIKREPYFDAKSKRIYYKGVISDVGDLSTFFGYDEHDMKGLTFQPAKIAEQNDSEISQLLENGYQFVKSKSSQKLWTEKPINYFTASEPKTKFGIDCPANFSLTSENKIRYTVVNGYLIDPLKLKTFSGNGIVLP